MPLTKKYLKSKPVCKVSFKMEKKATNGAGTLFLVGEFNNWEPRKPMKLLKDGSFSTTVDLETGKDYHYRFLTDDGNWLNDTRADRYEFDDFAGDDNCVVTT